MKFEIFHCSQYFVFLSPVFAFFKLRLATYHGLREIHLMVAAAVPLWHLHLVYRFQSPPSFPPHLTTKFLTVYRPDKGTVQLEAN